MWWTDVKDVDVRQSIDFFIAGDNIGVHNPMKTGPWNAEQSAGIV